MLLLPDDMPGCDSWPENQAMKWRDFIVLLAAFGL
jgi:hypothetical protein